MSPVSVVVLTFNSEATIGATLDSVAGLSDDVHVVDSGSTDGTLAIIAAKGAKLASASSLTTSASPSVMKRPALRSASASVR